MLAKKTIVFSNFDDLKNPYYGGGGSVAVHEVAKYLSRKYRAIVLTGKYPGSHDSVIDDVEYKRVGIYFKDPKICQLLYQILLPFYVIGVRHDIWLESFTPPWSTGFLQLFTRKPVIGVTHFLSAREKSTEYKLPFYLIQNLGLRTYKYIVVMSEELKQQVLSSSPLTKITIIPNGVQAMNFPKSREEDYFLYMGRLEIFQKGIDLLLEAFKKASSKIKTNLYIAGGGSLLDEKKLKDKVKALGLMDKVRFLNKVKGTKKTNLFTRTKCVVIPSRYEAFSLTAIESLSFGKPMICFDIRGLKWIDSGVALKVEPYSVNKLANSLVEVSKNRSLRHKMHKRSLVTSKFYEWSNISKKYDQLISRIIS